MYDTFLDRDPQKAVVFKNYRSYNRDLTKAYLRQAETQSLFEKAKGGALPEHQIKQKKEDDETFSTLGNLFNSMHRRCRYGQVPPHVSSDQVPTSHMIQKKLNIIGGNISGSHRTQMPDTMTGNSPNNGVSKSSNGIGFNGGATHIEDQEAHIQIN
jgi:hypothetical protein